MRQNVPGGSDSGTGQDAPVVIPGIMCEQTVKNGAVLSHPVRADAGYISVHEVCGGNRRVIHSPLVELWGRISHRGRIELARRRLTRGRAGAL